MDIAASFEDISRIGALTDKKIGRHAPQMVLDKVVREKNAVSKLIHSWHLKCVRHNGVGVQVSVRLTVSCIHRKQNYTIR